MPMICMFVTVRKGDTGRQRMFLESSVVAVSGNKRFSIFSILQTLMTFENATMLVADVCSMPNFPSRHTYAPSALLNRTNYVEVY